ncbi:hypothetical protein ACA910_016461 [Epithemia clementina (nom. ined.)]
MTLPAKEDHTNDPATAPESALPGSQRGVVDEEDDNTSNNPRSNSSKVATTGTLTTINLEDDGPSLDYNKAPADEPSLEFAAPTEWKMYPSYTLAVDPSQDDKATEINLFSWPCQRSSNSNDQERDHPPRAGRRFLGFIYIDLSRPHMRAFHCSWWCFFIAFFIWFAIAPLLPEIKDDLGLSKSEVWTSNIVGVGGTIVMRFILGPLCDKYGARILFAVVLCVASIPTACTGLVNSSEGLCILRLFIGIAGGTFVMCQYWTSSMFSREVVGTANAIVGGWGNLGGGVTQVVMGSVLFPLFKVFYDGNSEKAWRTVCVVPAVVAFASGIMVYYVSDDAPKGNYSDLKKHGVMPLVSATQSFRKGAVNLNTWLLFVQYGCCFGVELTMNNAAASYFHDEFGLDTEEAAAIASLFGWMNLFARGLGGYVSDYANTNYRGVQGRLRVQTLFLACEGALVLIFAISSTLPSAIIIMVAFSLFVQAAEGSTFGIVPYVDPPATGSVSGIVGAGGNMGAVLFGLGFLLFSYRVGFTIMGGAIFVSSMLSFFVTIRGQSRFLETKKTTSISGSYNDAEQQREEEADDSNRQEDQNKPWSGTYKTSDGSNSEPVTLVVPEQNEEMTREVNS